MEAIELNSFDQLVITVIKTHLFVTAMLCTFFLCSVLIGKSAEFAFIRTRKDARKRTTAETQPVDAHGEANVAATSTDSGQSFRPAEQKDGVHVKFWL